MKLLTIVVLFCAIGANSAFAQSTSTPTTVPPGSGNVATTTDQQQTAGQWVPPDEISNKTRAQVYRELIQAQQDGQIAYLNETLYAHH
jgi:hypothetical protein